ncbi:sensor histidine kinase, partial [Streptomyces sp. 8K308]|uniref:sensor histidine kinase n=1 Tax=Streptomyces sp. 8K308 TaxID=2530388 RepID=UPI0010435CE3
MRWSLIRRFLAVTAMVVVAFGVPLGMVVRDVAVDRAVSAAERQAALLAPAVVTARDVDDLERAVAETEAGAEDRITIDLPSRDGGPPDTLGRHRALPERLHSVAESGAVEQIDVVGGVALVQPIPLSGERTALIEVFVPSDQLTEGVVVAWLVLTGVGLALVVCSAAIADRLARRTVLSIEQLAQASRELGEGRLGVRVPVPEEGPGELRTAASAFNSMADRVAGLLAAERELAADLSHRLRTPLTVLRLNAASLGDGDAAEQTRHAVEKLEGEVDQIIRTARAHRDAVPDGRPREVTDAAEVIKDRMEFWSALAEDEGREVRLAGVEEPVPVPVARADLAAALDAMLGNVFRHTPEGTAFAVDMYRAGGAADAVIVLVSDAGPGIADPEAALRRGEGDGGRGSTGLGLDIASRLAESTGGDLRIGRSVLGGAEIRLWLARDGGWARKYPAPTRRRGTRHRARGQAPLAPLSGLTGGKGSGTASGSPWERAARWLDRQILAGRRAAPPPRRLRRARPAAATPPKPKT